MFSRGGFSATLSSYMFVTSVVFSRSVLSLSGSLVGCGLVLSLVPRPPGGGLVARGGPVVLVFLIVRVTSFCFVLRLAFSLAKKCWSGCRIGITIFFSSSVFRSFFPSVIFTGTLGGS